MKVVLERLEPWLSAPCGDCHFYMVFSLLNSWYVCILVSGNKIDVNPNSGLCFEWNVWPPSAGAICRHFPLRIVFIDLFCYPVDSFLNVFILNWIIRHKALIQWRNHRWPCILKFGETINLVCIRWNSEKDLCLGFFGQQNVLQRFQQGPRSIRTTVFSVVTDF